MKNPIKFIKTFIVAIIDEWRFLSLIWIGLVMLFVLGILALFLEGLISHIHESCQATTPAITWYQGLSPGDRQQIDTDSTIHGSEFMVRPQSETILELTASHEVRFYADGCLVGVLKFTDTGISFAGDADASAHRFIQALSQAWKDKLRTFSKNTNFEEQ